MMMLNDLLGCPVSSVSLGFTKWSWKESKSQFKWNAMCPILLSFFWMVLKGVNFTEYDVQSIDGFEMSPNTLCTYGFERNNFHKSDSHEEWNNI